MEKIKFEDGQLVRPAYVTIDNVEHEVTPATYEGNTPLSSYNLNRMQNEILEDGIIISPTEPTTDRRKIWFQKGKNLFNKNDVIKNMVLNRNNGNIISSEVHSLSGYCEVKPNTNYYLGISYSSSNYGVVFYDTNKKLLGGERLNSIFVTPEACVYVRFSWPSADYDINSIQLEQGTEATVYEPYVNPSIFVKNNNDEYEEFLKKEGKVALTAGLITNQTCTISTAWEAVKIKLDDVNYSGGKISLQDNEIKIGKGISKILVSANVSITEGISGTSQLYVRKNNSTVGKRALEYKNETYLNLIIVPQLIDVVEGDTISLIITASSTQSNKTIRADATYLTIHEI